MRAGAAGVDHALGDALVVEVHDLLAQVVVLEEHRAAGTRLERVVGVVEPGALGVGQVAAALRHPRLVGAGRLPGRRDGVRAALVGFGRVRLMGVGRLGDRRRFGSRLAGDAVLGARRPALQGVRHLVRRSLQGVRLAHQFQFLRWSRGGPGRGEVGVRGVAAHTGARGRHQGRTGRTSNERDTTGLVPRSPGRGVRNRESRGFPVGVKSGRLPSSCRGGRPAGRWSGPGDHRQGQVPPAEDVLIGRAGFLTRGRRSPGGRPHTPP